MATPNEQHTANLSVDRTRANNCEQPVPNLSIDTCYSNSGIHSVSIFTSLEMNPNTSSHFPAPGAELEDVLSSAKQAKNPSNWNSYSSVSVL